MKGPHTVLVYNIAAKLATYETLNAATWYHDCFRDVWGWLLPVPARGWTLPPDTRAVFQGQTYNAVGYSYTASGVPCEGVFLWRDARPL